MSLNALPTELDERLLGYLDRKELSAVSKISKYYRHITEPRLYSDIKFSSDEQAAVRWLIITLLERPQLAAFIKAVGLSKPDYPQDAAIRRGVSGELALRILQLLPKIRNVIRNSLRGKGEKDSSLRDEWLDAIVSVDAHGPFALIMCLAEQAESVTLSAAEGPHGTLLCNFIAGLHSTSYSDEFNVQSSPQPPVDDFQPLARLFSKDATLTYHDEILGVLPRTALVRNTSVG